MNLYYSPREFFRKRGNAMEPVLGVCVSAGTENEQWPRSSQSALPARPLYSEACRWATEMMKAS